MKKGLDFSSYSFDFSELKDKVKAIRKNVSNNTVLDTELKHLLALKERYANIPKIVDAKQKLDALVTVLIECSAHEERLVSIKNTLVLYRRKSDVLYTKALRIIQDTGELNNLSKTDRDELCSYHLIKFSDLCEDVALKIEQVDYTLEYVRNTSFNLKTIISTLKTGQPI